MKAILYNVFFGNHVDKFNRSVNEACANYINPGFNPTIGSDHLERRFVRSNSNLMFPSGIMVKMGSSGNRLVVQQTSLRKVSSYFGIELSETHFLTG